MARRQQLCPASVTTSADRIGDADQNGTRGLTSRRHIVNLEIGSIEASTNMQLQY
jgi:hypothetical protein